jgi:predicted Zn-dependent peptidase
MGEFYCISSKVRDACANNDISKLNHAIEKALFSHEYFDVFKTVFENDKNHCLVKHVVEKYGLPEDVTLSKVFKCGNLELIKYFVRVVKLERDAKFISVALDTILESSNASLLDYFVETFELSDDQMEECRSKVIDKMRHWIDLETLLYDAEFIESLMNKFNLSLDDIGLHETVECLAKYLPPSKLNELWSFAIGLLSGRLARIVYCAAKRFLNLN